MCIRDRNITVETLYGEKTLAYKDCMLERCHVCKGKEHQIFDETIGESRDTKDADRFAEVEKLSLIHILSPPPAATKNTLSRTAFYTTICSIRKRATRQKAALFP